MNLKERATTYFPATENLAVRIDKETMSAINNFREVFGKKTVASWLRDKIIEAVKVEKIGNKKTA